MSDVIKLLPDSVANQIAAGEVIQRPASVIKELVENAVDAHATSVQIILKDAGRTLIQVIDNGVGMSDTDARLAFERHSTSKIRQASDLFALSTMGFRGEALASIAAISHIELRTCAQGAQLGTRLLINASTCESQEPDVCPVGSNFMIKDLFFNVPARRKFLKSNQVELGNIVREFEKLALVNYSLSFSLTHNGNVMYKLTGGTFKQRIVDLFGRNIDQQLVPLAIETPLVKITGFVGKPENAKKRGYHQFFFVNGRFMRHPYFHRAVLSCYDELVPTDQQPSYFLIFDVDPESIDVNIHPTKTEIKFENELPIWQIVVAAVKETLGRFNVVPSIDFNNEDAPSIPVAQNGGSNEIPSMGIDSDYNPFMRQEAQPATLHFKDSTGQQRGSHARRGSSGTYGNEVMPNWDELYRNFEKKKNDTPAPADMDVAQPAQATLPLATTAGDGAEEMPIFQVGDKYLVAGHGNALLIIDQHRAHLQVLYERLMQQIDGQNIVAQRVLFPEVLHLAPEHDVILQAIEHELEKIGFNFSRLSGNDWSITAIPQGLDNVNIPELLTEVIDNVERGGNSIKERIYENIALMVARKAAIGTKTLTGEEMKRLLADWSHLRNRNYTQGGKPIVTTLTPEQVGKMF